jgi:hypothetical protein
MKEQRIEYDCKENDNTIMIEMIDGTIDELLVGCRYIADHGWSVIGVKDLTDALKMAGYSICKDGDDK